MMIDQAQIDVLWAMVQQELSTYRIVRQDLTGRTMTSTQNLCCELFQKDTCSEYRYNMVDWCYRMIDFCHLHRETVAIAMNFVDRFVVSGKGKVYLMNDSLYQLVAVTALYTAIKVHEIQAIDLQTLKGVLNVTYSISQIEQVEREMIEALKWRLNPPTAMSFVRYFVETVPPRYKLSTPVKEKILMLSCIQTEFAVLDEELLEIKSSTIGYCSVINALSVVVNDQGILRQIRNVLAQTLQIHKSNYNEVTLVQSKLYILLCSHQNKNSPFTANGSYSFDRHRTLSHTKQLQRSTTQPR